MLRSPTRHLLFFASLGLLDALCMAGVEIDVPPARPIEFDRDVRPILADHCYACHGPDEEQRRSGLRLDTVDGSRRDLGGTRAIVPGAPDESELIRRILTDDVDARMPPEEHHKALVDEQKDLLVAWVKQGAEYEPHWAYTPIRRSGPPAVLGERWPISTIDRHVLARLEREGLEPSSDADAVTLIRRLSFDLTGLPPTPDEVERFRNDDGPGAYERLIDRLLASEGFGERLASYWFDLVRYADTCGYHADLEWSVSPYRDYVIDAFNANMPFDRFTREQLAGDLLENPTVEQRIAAGYNRLNMKSTEGGIQDKEYVAKYAADRLRTTAVTWMGATLGCAQCHDHKYDPYTTKDFYRFTAFFADIKHLGFYPGAAENGWGETMLVEEEDIERLSAEKEKLTGLEDELATLDLDEPRATWEAKVTAPGYVAAYVFDSRGAPESWRYTLAKPDGDWASPAFDDLGWEVGDGAFGKTAAPDGKIATKWVTHDIWLRKSFRLDVIPTRLFLQIEHDDDARVHLNGALVREFPNWTPDFISYEIPAELLKHLRVGENTLAVHCHQGSGGQIIDVGLSDTPSGSGRALPDELATILRTPIAARTEEEQAMVAAHYRTFSPEVAALEQRIEAQRLVVRNFKKDKTTMLATVAVEPRVTRVLPRGDWMSDDGEVVQPGVPAFLRQIEREGRATRLDLADWLVAEDNPLTSRTFVNRIWRLFFGAGISTSVEDNGAQGVRPEHPRLLDDLAADFMTDWDVKRLIKRIVMSRTYRQSSLMRDELRDVDPSNRWLARQSRFRLDAEMVRDNSLAASGLLVLELGGPSVKPYQPKGYWDHLYFPKRDYPRDDGDKLYRRSVYTHWQRQFLHPSMLLFDAPTREECAPTRARSNTPLSALALLNDPANVEAARNLAALTLQSPHEAVAARLDFIGARVLSRAFGEREKEVLAELLASESAAYRADPDAAARLLAVGEREVAAGLDPVELAAWTAVARATLNMHETITRN